MSKREVLFGSLAGAVAIHLAFYACGGGSRPDGGMMDVVRNVIDGSTRDARAQGTVMMSACDQTATYATGNDAGYSRTQSAYYASFQLPGLDPTTAPAISSVVCGHSVLPATYPYGDCPSGYTCTQSGAPYPNLDCAEAVPQLELGRVIVWCGVSGSTVSNGGTTQSEDRFQRVYLKIN